MRVASLLLSTVPPFARITLISVDHLKQGTLALEGMKYFCTSAAHLIADITPDPALRNVLAGSALLYGGLKDVSTFYQHAIA